MHNEQICFAEDGHLEPATDFPWHELDGALEVAQLKPSANFREAILFAHDAPNSKLSLACLLIITGDPSQFEIAVKETARRFRTPQNKVRNICAQSQAALDPKL